MKRMLSVWLPAWPIARLSRAEPGVAAVLAVGEAAACLPMVAADAEAWLRAVGVVRRIEGAAEQADSHALAMGRKYQPLFCHSGTLAKRAGTESG